jgi:hypothetical protein
LLLDGVPASPVDAQHEAPKHRLRSDPGATEKAFVRFTSQLEARRAVRERQGGFCGNNQVRLRVLE